MRFTSLALLLCATNLLVGCGESGNTNVMQNADAEEIAAYEDAVRKAEEQMTEGMSEMSPEKMKETATQSGQ